MLGLSFDFQRCVYLLPLHAPVLEPDLDLPLREAEAVGDFNPPPSRQVAIKMELFFQLERLVARVRRPLPLRLSIGIHRVYNNIQSRKLCKVLFLPAAVVNRQQEMQRHTQVGYSKGDRSCNVLVPKFKTPDEIFDNSPQSFRKLCVVLGGFLLHTTRLPFFFLVSPEGPSAGCHFAAPGRTSRGRSKSLRGPDIVLL